MVLVSDLWEDGRGWDLNSITPFISENMKLELLSLVVDNVTGAQNRLSWGENAEGKFTVRSAYSLLRRDKSHGPNMAQFYKRIWTAKVPERISMSLWLVANQTLMTNAERHHRHLSEMAICPVCRGGVETIIHILRDCPAMEGLWRRILPTSRREEFFQMSLLPWLFYNLGIDSVTEETPWTITFSVACWWSWKWRCGNIFGETRLCRDRVQFIRSWSKEVFLANRTGREQADNLRREERMIAWSLPRAGWFKLNTDGASHGNPGLATAGGVLRNTDGEWCTGFALNIGRCTAPLAELWGVYYGLCLAWERQVEHLELEVDSELVAGFLTTGIGDTHPLSFLVRLCRDFLSKNWSVRVSHVYREANRLADGLANYAFTLLLGLHSFDFVHEFVISLCNEDLEGRAIARQIRL